MPRLKASKSPIEQKKKRNFFNSHGPAGQSFVQSSHNGSLPTLPRKSKVMRLSQNRFMRAEEHRKRHIVFLCRRHERKQQIILFAHRVAALKIQRYWRGRKFRIAERERIAFENHLMDIRRVLASIVINKRYVNNCIICSAKKCLAWWAHLRSVLAHHSENNMKSVIAIQQHYRAWKNKPKKLNVAWFKARLLAYIKGRTTRRKLAHPAIMTCKREALDLINIKNDLLKDIKQGEKPDQFYEQINKQAAKKSQEFITKLESIGVGASYLPFEERKIQDASQRSKSFRQPPIKKIEKPLRRKTQPEQSIKTNKIGAKPVTTNIGSDKKAPTSVPQEKRHLSLKTELLPVANVSIPLMEDAAKERPDNATSGSQASGEKPKFLSMGKMGNPKQTRGKTVEAKTVNKLKSPKSGKHMQQEEGKLLRPLPLPMESSEKKQGDSREEEQVTESVAFEGEQEQTEKVISSVKEMFSDLRSGKGKNLGDLAKMKVF